MSSILTRDNLDLIALQLDRTKLREQVTGLELLQRFESIGGFWQACVEMVTPTSMEVSDLLKKSDEAKAWSSSDIGQILEIGIRDQAGDLTASFCGWFDSHCSFDSAAGTRHFLLPHMRPTEFADLYGERSNDHKGAFAPSSRQQLQTKFANSVIERMNITSDASPNEIYPDFAQKAVALADEEKWPQDLMVEIENGTGIVLVSYITTGSASRVTKKVTPRNFGRLLSRSRASAL